MPTPRMNRKRLRPMRKTMKSSRREQTMNATKQLAARAGMVVCSVLAVALTGCRTHVVHERTRTVYVPTPPPPPVVEVTPVPAPPPPVIVAPPVPPQPPAVIVVTSPEPPPVVVIQSEADFYEPLTAYGRWVVVAGYGRCWVPARVEAGWRPYANGYWQRTDAGWYWASEEPWGWATYHYGRWDFTMEHGWVWIPQTQWAPAWVAWREGGGYVGWAPLRPSFSLNVSIGTPMREPAFESRAFVFVEHRRMLEPVRPKTVVVNNTTVINQTVNITNVRVVNKTVINEGPRPEVIERESGRKLRSVPAQEFRRQEEATMAGRDRNLPARDRRDLPPARVEIQPAVKTVAPPSVVPHVEKPTAVQPARPTPPRLETKNPARQDVKPETEIGRRATPLPTSVETPKKPGPVAIPRREPQPTVNPTVLAKPATSPIATPPAGDERKRERTVEAKNPITPPVVEPGSRQETRPQPARAAGRPGKTEPATPASIRQQTSPPVETPAEKRVISPKEKSQAARPAEPNKIKSEVRRPTLKDKGQEPDAAPTQPAR